MKSPQIILTAALLCLGLSACAPEATPAVTTAQTALTTTAEPIDATTALTTGKDEPIQVPVGGIGEKSERFDYTKDEKTVLSVTLSLPVASITGDDALQSTLTGRLDAIEAEIRGYAEDLRDKYEADIASGKEGLAVPSLQVRFALNYFTSEAAGLTYFYNETTSEGITLRYSRFCNVDLRVGSEIQLSALLNEGASDTLANRISEAVGQSGTAGLYEGRKDLITDLMDERWYMTRTELVFCFGPGDLAPVSSGEILVRFDKAALADLLSSYGSALIEDNEDHTV